MKATICKSWTFDAAHRLPKLPESHKCHHMHGHTYRVELKLEGRVIDEGTHLGMVIDYDVLDEFVAPVLAQLDHKVLNEVKGLEEAPTTEHLAAWLWKKLWGRMGGFLRAVRVYESSTTWAEVTEGEWEMS